MNNNESRKPRNNIVITIICCVLVAGITLAGVYLFMPESFGRAKENTSVSPPGMENKNYDIPAENNQNDIPVPPDNGLAENPENRPRQDVPYDPQTGGRVSGKVNDDGTGKWSTDGGKTWNDTPPEGMPDPNDHNKE